MATPVTDQLSSRGHRRPCSSHCRLGSELARAYRMHAHLRIEAGRGARRYGQRAMAARGACGRHRDAGRRLEHHRDGAAAERRPVGSRIPRAQPAPRARRGPSRMTWAWRTSISSGWSARTFSWPMPGAISRTGLRIAPSAISDRHTLYLQAWLALVRLAQGGWEEAAELALSVLQRPGASCHQPRDRPSGSGVDCTRGAVRPTRSRCSTMRSSWQRTSGVLHRIETRSDRARGGGVAAGRYEGHPRRGARRVRKRAPGIATRGIWADFAFWRWRAGDLDVPPVEAAPPFALRSPATGRPPPRSGVRSAVRTRRRTRSPTEMRLRCTLRWRPSSASVRSRWPNASSNACGRWVCAEFRVGRATPRAPIRCRSPW